METESEVRYVARFKYFQQAFNGVTPRREKPGPLDIDVSESEFHAKVIGFWGFTFDPLTGEIKGMPFCEDPIERMVNADTVVGQLIQV